MNGRVYDPFLARFLSPDPLVQAPGYGQNFNRYSYAFNNPLKYTDPDGEFAHLIIGALIGGTINWLANGADFSWQGLGYFGVGAAAGALSAGIGAGIGGLVGGAGSFSFSVANSLSVGGFFPGMAIGASAGFTNGFVSGTGNSLIAGNKLGSALGNGMKMGIIQGGTGALLGGIAGGIRANSYGGDFWTGRSPGISSQGRLPFNGSQQLAVPELEVSLAQMKHIPGSTRISNAGIKFITKFENYSSTAYKVGGKGNFTIGFGHEILPGENFISGITRDQAYNLLNQDIQTAVNAINRNVTIALNQHQIDALTSYVFNTGSLYKTKLLMNLNVGNFLGAAHQMDIITQGGVILRGLQIRRLAEQNLFLYGKY